MITTSTQQRDKDIFILSYLKYLDVFANLNLLPNAGGEKTFEDFDKFLPEVYIISEVSTFRFC